MKGKTPMSKKNINRKRPQDFRRASAGPVVLGPESVEFEGETYTVDFNAVNDIEVLEAFQRPAGFFSSELNGAMTALQKALGDEEYNRFKQDQVAKHGKCSATALFELFSMVNAGAAGNSFASSSSSSGEAKHSRPTSNGTTAEISLISGEES